MPFVLSSIPHGAYYMRMDLSGGPSAARWQILKTGTCCVVFESERWEEVSDMLEELQSSM